MTREITIRPVLNGYVCQVGCQQVVFGSPAELGDNITAYYKSPDEVEARFLKRAVNPTIGPQPAEPPTAPYPEPRGYRVDNQAAHGDEPRAVTASRPPTRLAGH